jgi:hypothetical protein
MVSLLLLAPAFALSAQLVIDHGTGRHALTITSGTPVETPTLRVHLDAAPAGVLFEYTLTIAYRQATQVHRETLELAWAAPASARAIFRDGRLRDLNGSPLHVDAFGAKYVEADFEDSAIVLSATGDLEGLTAQKLAGGRLRVSLELDDTANHPFRAESRCVHNWRHPAKMADHSTRQRAAGEIATYRFFLGRTAAHPTPLVMQRFSAGARAALAWTDHADQSSYETLRALLYGSAAFGGLSEPSPAGPLATPGRSIGRGIVGHHLRFTKALFFDSVGLAKPQLEDTRVRTLAQALVAAGSEVIPHSATPRSDTRATTERALRFFHNLSARNWIDHQPETNCEALTDRGWKPGDPFYIGDLFAQYGIRYAWSGLDPIPPDGGLNMLGARTPWLYRFAPNLYLWSSVWMYLEAPRFFVAMAPDRLDRLEDERGLHIAHTYLESLHPRGRYRARHVLVQDGNAVVTSPEFEALLAELERRQERGTLEVAPVSALADHALALAHVELRYQEDGRVVLRNSGNEPIAGATFTAPCEVTVDGTAPRHARTESDGYTFWLDLLPGREVVVQLEQGAFLTPVSHSLPQ